MTKLCYFNKMKVCIALRKKWILVILINSNIFEEHNVKRRRYFCDFIDYTELRKQENINKILFEDIYTCDEIKNIKSKVWVNHNIQISGKLMSLGKFNGEEMRKVCRLIFVVFRFMELFF